MSSWFDTLDRQVAKLREDPIFSKTIIILFATSLLIRIYFILKYNELDYEADSYMHYLGSQAWIHAPFNNFDFLINWWYKSLFTLLSGIVLKFTVENIAMIKLMNTAIWMGILYLIYLIAKKHKLSNEAILFSIFFASFSFLAFRSSISALTEPLFTIFIAAAYYFLLKERFALSAALVSASLLCRSEGTIFIIIWCVYLLINQKYKSIIILTIFPLCWDLIGFMRTGDLLYIMNNEYPLNTISVYGSGNFNYYILGLLQYEPIIFLLFIMSFFLCASRFKLAKICVLSLLIFNIIIWKYGWMGSSGYLRYLVPTVPLMSLLASTSLIEITKFMKYINIRYILYLIIALSQITYTTTLINGNGWGYGENNYPWVNKELINSGTFIRSLDANKILIAENPVIIYFSGRVLGISAAQWFDRISGAQKPDFDLNESNGFYFAYDDEFSENDAKYKKLDYYLNNSSFKLLKNFSGYVYMFEWKK